MASPSSFQFLLLLSSVINLLNILQAHAFHLHSSATVLPIIKDHSTLQYVTTIYHGSASQLLPIKLVVHLGGTMIWVDCSSGFGPSSRRPIPSQSIQCSRTGAARDRGSKSCDLFPENGNTGLATRGELVEDTIAVWSTEGSNVNSLITTVDHFLFSCAPIFLLQGLASGAKGMLGLGRAPISLPSQLATAIGHNRKFFLCLSSSNGVIFSRNNDAPKDSIFGTKTRSLMYTPLVGTSQDYFISIKSIVIAGTPLSLDGKILAKLSTMVPYTTMESSIYATFTKAYNLLASKNMTRVAPVAPFGVCYGSKGADGSSVPVIDMVLQSELVKWRIHGSNSIVRVSQEVMCLGFLDGGADLASPIVIGAAQLEDNLLEFDLGTSMLGFSSLRQTSCSNFMSDSMLQKSL